MDNSENKSKLLRAYLNKISPGIFDDRRASLESMTTSEHEMTGLESSLETLASQRTISPLDSFGIEAIVHKKFRPALFVINDSFSVPPAPWVHLGEGNARKNIENALPSIGRVELPESDIPYGGTGFLVGPGLVMTNRHVANIFAQGLGTKLLRFKSGFSPKVNFRKEVIPTPEIQDLIVTNVSMIHPYWDMALLHVDGLPNDHGWLTLSTTHTDQLIERDIAVVGYPAQDRRNNLDLQNEIFGGVFNVKRMQPGKLEPRRDILSFGNNVSAVTHDASTLGGNSGSAVIDVETGNVLALHFAGLYLDANFAVPAFELARDSRVINAGVAFDGKIELGKDWDGRWTLADSITEVPSLGSDGPDDSHLMPQTIDNEPKFDASSASNATAQKNVISLVIPLTISVSLGHATNTTSSAAAIEKESNFTEAVSRRDNIEQKAYQNANVSELQHADFTALAALTSAAASTLVYSDSPSHIEDICLRKLGFSSCEFIKNSNTECFIATDNITTLVSFRGTQGIRDWIANMNIAEMATDFGMVHGGFLEAFLDIKRELETMLDNILTGQQLVLTGHSLGGALATIATSEWRNKYPIRSTFTFGQPAVGDKEFRDSMQSFSNRIHRVVNDDDIVTKIPPPYRHVGTKFTLSKSGNLQRHMTESLQTHGMEDTNELMAEAAFHQLQAQLDSSGGSLGTEGILPSFSDHKIANYLFKLLKLSNIT